MKRISSRKPGWFVSLLVLIQSFTIVSANAEKIKVLTFNTWGVPLEVWDTWRYAAAMRAIEKLNPDFVVLDEVFSLKGKKAYQSYLYPYMANGPRMFPKLSSGGTRILSKYPFDSVASLVYQHCASSDCLSRKGAAIVTVTLPSGKILNLAGTHLDSGGTDDLRTDQLRQLKIFTDYYADPKAPLLIAGDFNCGPKSSTYQYAREQMQLSDSWTETHPATDLGLTYDSYQNHYAHDYEIKTHDLMIVDRIDFMFHQGAIKPVSTEVIFNTEDSLYSDHYGILAEFEI